jgi:pyruvate,orthophosphate dikinase
MKYIRDLMESRDGDEIFLLGSKGIGLSSIFSLGLNVPSGFVITTDLCKEYYRNNKQLPQGFDEELTQAINLLEKKTNKVLGKDLLVSVRSGSAVSMPGMMDTVLNATGDIEVHVKKVLESWMSFRAVTYRKLHDIPEHLGTAVIIQAMVFGDKDELSGTGVVFTRNPSNGQRELYGEFLRQVQGEALVAGTHTPSDLKELEILMPEVYKELSQACSMLENYYSDMQDIEFTIESGRLYILQTRLGKRTTQAAIKIAVDMVNEGKLTRQEAILRIDPSSINQLLHSKINNIESHKTLTQGLPASPGAATGIVVFSANEAEKASQHHKVILVRHDTSPEDIHGMGVSSGILTARGGMTSHAAVVARGMGKPCISGASDIKIGDQELIIGQVRIKAGETITIDGDSGRVFLGNVPKIIPEFSVEFDELMRWADEFRRLQIRANVENENDARVALKMGAEGIGLCRTEHMFFEPTKLRLMRKMIIASNQESRKEALSELMPLHKEDFKAVFRVMHGLPVTVRLLDPPLHEFLPRTDDENKILAQELGISLKDIEIRLDELDEVNPMLGFRGCRLGIVYPEIYAMQIEAIFAAMAEIEERPILEIMVPLVSKAQELQKVILSLGLDSRSPGGFTRTLDQAQGGGCAIGTMIELPRAALQADKIAAYADFFSFGTNDLTQTTYGISRDDVASFVPHYLENGLMPNDPFATLDQEGVGELIKIAVERGRKVKPDLKIGICGEHGGDPASIEFFHKAGLDYVSCSPYRVTIARLAAARASLINKKKKI